MDRPDLGAAAPVHPSPLSSPFPSFSALAKPCSVAGQQKPRQAKARKHTSSTRARPAVILDAGAGAGLNPFGQAFKLEHSSSFTFGSPSEAKPGGNVVGIDGAFSFGSAGLRSSVAGDFVLGGSQAKSPEDPAAGSVPKVYTKGSLFDSACGETFPEIINAQTWTFEPGESGISNFVFGSGEKKDSTSQEGLLEDSSSADLDGAKPERLEAPGFGADSVPDQEVKGSGFVLTGEEEGLPENLDVLGRVSVEPVNQDGENLVSDSGANDISSSSSSSENLPRNSGGMDMGGSEYVSSGTTGLVFDTASVRKERVEDSMSCSYHEERAADDKLNTANTVGAELMNLDSVTFDFGSGVKNNSDSQESMPGDSSDASFGSPDKVKFGTSGFVFGAESVANQEVEVSAFGRTHDDTGLAENLISLNSLRVGQVKLDDAAFVSSSGVKENSNALKSLPSDTFGFNLGGSEPAVSETTAFVFGAASMANQKKKESGFGFGRGKRVSQDKLSSLNLAGDEPEKSDIATFVFGSGVTEGSNSEESFPDSLGGANLGGFKSVKFETSHFVFGADSVISSYGDNSEVNSICEEKGIPGQKSVSDTESIEPVKLDRAIFASGCVEKQSPNLEENFPRDLNAVNLADFVSTTSKSTEFNVGAGMESDHKVDGSEFGFAHEENTLKDQISPPNIICADVLLKSGNATSVFSSEVSDSQEILPKDSSDANICSLQSVKFEASGFVSGADSAPNDKEKISGFRLNLEAKGLTENRGNPNTMHVEQGELDNVTLVSGSGIVENSSPLANMLREADDVNLGGSEPVKSNAAGSIPSEKMDSECGLACQERGPIDKLSPPNIAGTEPIELDSETSYFGSAGKQSSDSQESLSKGLDAANLSGYDTVQSRTSVYVFGTGSEAVKLEDHGFGFAHQKGGSESVSFLDPSGAESTVSSSSTFVFGPSSSSTFNRKKSAPGKIPNHPNFNASTDNRNSDILVSKSKTSPLIFGSASGRSDNSNAGAFVFGSDMRTSSNLFQDSFHGSNKGSSSTLHETRELSSQKDDDIDDDLDKSKQVDQRAKMGETNDFILCSDIGASSLSSDNDKIVLQEEMKKSATEIGTPAGSTRSENTDDPPPIVFIFESNATKSSPSAQMSTGPSTHLNESIALEASSDSKDMNPEGCADNHIFRNNETLGEDANNEPRKFGFESSASASDNYEGTAVDTLNDGVEKVNVCEENEGLVHNTESIDTSDVELPISTEFIFQAKMEDGSRKSESPGSKSQGPLRSGAFLSSSSFGPGFQSLGPNFAFSTMENGIETSKGEHLSKMQEASGPTRENFSMQHQKMTHRDKGESRSTKTKKKVGKLKISAVAPETYSAPVFSRKEGSSERLEPEISSDYLPTSFPSFRVNLLDEQCSKKDSAPSDCFLNAFIYDASGRTGKSNTAGPFSGKDSVDGKIENIKKDIAETTHYAESNFVAKSYSFHEEAKSHFGDSNFKAQDVEAKTAGFSSNVEISSEGRSMLSFSSCSEDFGGSDFTFATSSSDQSSLLLQKHSRRKNKAKVGWVSPSSNLFHAPSIFASSDASQNLQRMLSGNRGVNGNSTDTNKVPDAKDEHICRDEAEIGVAAPEDCEKWRARGNQAYAEGQLARAEEYYTRGIHSLYPNVTSQNCQRTVMLCYSNRAAARISLGRVREALNDCMMAAEMDPTFLKARVRAANCLLSLGETEDAIRHFKELMELTSDACVDPKVIEEVSDGLQKAQKLADYMVQSGELLTRRSSSEVSRALQLISDALSISTYSDSFMEMKAEALLMLRRYEEVIQFCEQTLDLAERNSLSSSADGQSNSDSSKYVIPPAKLWRWHLISKSYFHLGKLEESLELLKKYDQVTPVASRYENTSPESASSLLATIRELLRLKTAGNDAFQAGRYSEAVEYYTAALSCNAESHPFTAVCFANRAAAHQALGQITDAIADCSLAIALDSNYAKAISRRATLYEMIRDYGQAANDVLRFISLLEKQLQENQSGASGKSNISPSDLNRARIRLSVVEDEARRKTPLNMYLILGIEPSSSASDVKKAYRKAALRHHPDKAGQLLMRSENIDDALWREVTNEVRRDADHLFKVIGEAYAILSVASKRQKYDSEEQTKRTTKKGNSISSKQKSQAGQCSSQHDKSGTRRS